MPKTANELPEIMITPHSIHFTAIRNPSTQRIIQRAHLNLMTEAVIDEMYADASYDRADIKQKLVDELFHHVYGDLREPLKTLFAIAMTTPYAFQRERAQELFHSIRKQMDPRAINRPPEPNERNAE